MLHIKMILWILLCYHSADV